LAMASSSCHADDAQFEFAPHSCNVQR
jgi:hypothetical protein